MSNWLITKSQCMIFGRAAFNLANVLSFPNTFTTSGILGPFYTHIHQFSPGFTQEEGREFNKPSCQSTHIARSTLTFSGLYLNPLLRCEQVKIYPSRPSPRAVLPTWLKRALAFVLGAERKVHKQEMRREKKEKSLP